MTVSPLDLSREMLQALRLTRSRRSPYHGVTGRAVGRVTRSVEALQRRGLLSFQKGGSGPFAPDAFTLTEKAEAILDLLDKKERT